MTERCVLCLVFFVGLESFSCANGGIFNHNGLFLCLKCDRVLTCFKIEIKFAVVVTCGVGYGVVCPFRRFCLGRTAVIIRTVFFVKDVFDITVGIENDLIISQNVDPSFGHTKVTNLGERNLAIDAERSFYVSRLGLDRVVRNLDRIERGLGNGNSPCNRTFVRKKNSVFLAFEIGLDFRALGESGGIQSGLDGFTRVERINAVLFPILVPFVVAEYFKSFIGDGFFCLGRACAEKRCSRNTGHKTGQHQNTEYQSDNSCEL